MISAGWCRSLINHRIDRVRRVFKWATAEELVPVTVYQPRRTLAGLQKGRSTVRDSEPVTPVDPVHVAAALPYLSRHVRVMVELQQLTGMRPGEVCAIKFAEIDRSSEVWVYRPRRHKTARRGKPRAVPLAFQTLRLGERHLGHLMREFVIHSNEERPHQAKGNVSLPDADEPEPRVLPFPSGEVKYRQRLGGLLKYYYRGAA
jgi:integrase